MGLSKIGAISVLLLLLYEDFSLFRANRLCPYSFLSQNCFSGVLRWRGFISSLVFQGQIKVKGQRLRGSQKVWERLQPVVKCRDDNMTLTVRRRGVGQLLLHPGEATSQSQRLASTHTGQNNDINTF